MMYFTPFTKSPFGFMESNEDMMKHYFERIKRLNRDRQSIICGTIKKRLVSA